MRYVDVAIDNKSPLTDELYTYGCDFPEVSVGSRVQVNFGAGKTLRDAYVFAVRDELPEEIPGLKYVASVYEEAPLDADTMALCRWMHGRYLCRYIDAVKLFVPPGKASVRGKRRSPLLDVEGEAQDIETLTGEQAAALGTMERALDAREGGIFLLQGVTGSGKTEVYMRLIERVLKGGQTAIMMVPEISLTKQIVDRFVGRFGAAQIALFHSGLSPGERHDEWQRVKSGEAKIAVGARSAIFAPLTNVGVAILDEEHEATYKSDMSPKYDTLELAIKRTKKSGGLVVLGSATPSVVSYERSERGVYRRLELNERYNKVELPSVECVDMRRELAGGNTTMISKRLFEEMNRTLSEGEQVILFMNRRGYQTFVSCRECGHVAECPTCGISLTYHKGDRALVCHYCGHKEPLPKVCPSCASRYIKGFGTGTEKVEEVIGELFPDMSVGRLDLDVMKKKGALERTLEDFGKGRTRILVGTQVVAKGLDFRHVGLVGVVSADVLLNIPDYRAPERAFQLITQAAGRAGRGDKKGKVIIQTYTPGHYAVRTAADQDYRAFYRAEMERRKRYLYPPFADILQVVFGGKKEGELQEAAARWRDALLAQGASPAQVLLAGGKEYLREQTEHRECLLIRSLPGEKEAYMRSLSALKAEDRRARRSYSIVVDVNPYTLWRS